MEAICSSETSVDTQGTTGRYIPKDGTIHVQNDSRELKMEGWRQNMNNKEWIFVVKERKVLRGP
jgi:hypothetical protein